MYYLFTNRSNKELRFSSQVCEKVVEKVPSAVEKQSCHEEEKKVCQMEERKQPKQVKRYLYKKECKQVPRQVSTYGC